MKSPDSNCALNARALALPGASHASAPHASAALSAALSHAIGARSRSRRSAMASADTSIAADIGRLGVSVSAGGDVGAGAPRAMAAALRISRCVGNGHSLRKIATKKPPESSAILG